MSAPPRIPTLGEGNDLFPLPPDYNELTPGGAREARVAACRQWQRYGPERGMSKKEAHAARKTLGEVYVQCLRFFEEYYLLPDRDEDGDVVWNPMFYDVEDVLPNPRFHDVMTAAAIAYPRVAMVAPRGSSKSYWCSRDMMLRMLSKPKYSFVYSTSSGDLSKEMGERTRAQLYYNEKILEDWSPEYGGALQPSNRRASTGVEKFALTNESWMSCTSITSRQRGNRPKRYRLDDPEYDPDASTDMATLRSATEHKLFRVIMPMVMRADCGVDWIGTYISRQHLLYHATATQKKVVGGKDVYAAEDPRFNSWVRINQPVTVEDADGRVQSCWPHMWPVDEAEKERLGLNPNTVTIPQLKEYIGPAAFASEYMNDPGEAGEHYFDELTLERHGYRILNADEEARTDPWNSTASVEWWEKMGEDTGKRLVLPMQKMLNDYGPTFALVDTSFTNTRTSDRKAIVICSRGPHNTIFLWDIWSGRCDESSVFVPKIMELCDRWRCAFMGVETVRSGASLYGKLEQIVNTRASQEFGVKHMAMPRKVHPGVTAKEARIAQALGWRVEMNRLKLPWGAGDNPALKRLFEQFETWNPNEKGGGQQHDDELDALHMYSYVVKGRMAPSAEGEKQEDIRAIDRLKSGDYGNFDKDQLIQMALVSSTPGEISELVRQENPDPSENTKKREESVV